MATLAGRKSGKQACQFFRDELVVQTWNGFVGHWVHLADDVVLDLPEYLPIAVLHVVIVADSEALLVGSCALRLLVLSRDAFIVEDAGNLDVNVTMLVLVFPDQHVYRHERPPRQLVQSVATAESILRA